MGCCASTNASHIPNPKTNIKRSSKSPPLQEEETVKEVLSETPTILKRPPPPFQVKKRSESPFVKASPLLMPELSKPPPDARKPRNGVVPQKPYVANEEPSEEVSEICSTVSESVSVSTTVTEKTEIKNQDIDIVSKSRIRSPARFGRDNSAGKSPCRRSDPSPGRIRPGPGTGLGRRNDRSGESSVRRSRSPVTRTDSGSVKPGASRVQPVWKTGKSPSRLGSGSRERIRKLDEEDSTVDNKWPVDSNELLENPLVSLECFIFL